jgi:predicted phage terminase large subunit-like protein
MRIKGEVESEQTSGVFKMYPLIDNNKQCIWKGKYPDEKALADEKKKVSNENAWQREYLLRIIPADDQVIYPEWIKYYDELPQGISYEDGFKETILGVDLAISQKSSADYFTIVSAYVYEKDSVLKIYILGNTVNKRCTFPEQVELIKHMALSHKNSYLCIESVGYQESIVQQLKHDGVERIKSVNVSIDKRSRLQATTAAIQNGQILFPRVGADDLIQQLVGFGTEKHDDLVDAFTLCINHILETYLNKPFVGFI